MSNYLIKPILRKLIISFVALTMGLASYATEPDTFNLREYKIKNLQLKRYLSKIAEGETNKHHRQVALVVTCFRQEDGEYVVVGCQTLARICWYSWSMEVNDYGLIGCAYLENSICLLFGSEIEQYLSDPIGMVCLVDSNDYFKPLLGSEADLQEFRDDCFQIGLHLDPPSWIFKKQKKKYRPIDIQSYDYNPISSSCS